MNKNILILLIGLVGLFTSCEKDGDQVVMLEDPIVPTIQTMPNLNYDRTKGEDVLEFVGTPVDPGFSASATYFLEASAASTDFSDLVQLYSGIEVESIKITVSDLNQMLLKKLPEDKISSVDFRIRTTLLVDGGTGAESFEYLSATTTADVPVYGLLRLDLNGSGMTQKITSPLGDGVYASLVKFNSANPFTLTDPETDISYGGAAGALVVDGSSISVNNGWHILEADINGLTYSMEEYQIGLIGDATPNGWDDPDTKMEYDLATGTWSITVDLIVGNLKFRKNDGWAWNMGYVEGETPSLSGATQQGGYGNDIPITEAGNYTVIFTIFSDDEGAYELIKN